MGLRLLSGAIGLCIVLPVLWFGGVGVAVLVAVVVALAMDEWALMMTRDMPAAATRTRLTLVPLGLALHVAVTHVAPTLAGPLVAVVVMIGLTVPMFAEADVARAGTQAVRGVAGLVYAPLLVAPLVALRGREDGIWMVLYLFAATWLGDTGAYFAGRAFGRTPLFARVSPKKTVEGAVGGLAASAIGGVIFAKVGNLPFGVIECVLLTMLLDVLGVVGDLAESLVKRTWDVKDSGWVMPGHGGILDRIDSLCFTTPVLWLWLELR